MLMLVMMFKNFNLKNGIYMNAHISQNRTLLLLTALIVTLFLSACSKKSEQKPTTPIITYDRLLDVRDGKRYKTVIIGGKKWMAENLNYRTDSSWCYGDDTSYCDKFGRLYDWQTAQTVCPAGWRLPSVNEWDNLTQTAGIEKVDRWGYVDRSYGAGKKLKTKNGWNDYLDGNENINEGNGTDDYGFSALPGGHRFGSRYDGVLNAGFWWTGTDYSDAMTLTREMHNNIDYVIAEKRDNDYGFSVRCLYGGDGGKSPDSTARMTADSTERIEEERKREETLRRIEKNTGYFTDLRDGRKYRTIKIGSKRWMAENLNYQPRSGKFWCYDDDASYCDIYGKLYDWETALTVCPAGWRLPSRRAWNDLIAAVSDKNTGVDEDEEENDDYGENVDVGKLKAKSHWKNHLKGTDDYGFSALPCGARSTDGEFNSVGQNCSWWSSTETSRDNAYNIGLYNYLSKDDVYKTAGCAVRCVEYENPHTVTLSSVGAGAKGGGRFEPGDTVVIAAGFAQGLQFKNWTSTRSDVSFVDANNTMTKFVMPANNVTVTANFDTIVVESGEFTDTRDGKTYKTVVINGKTWMAKNLNYRPKTGRSWCYDNNNSNCAKYGRLYDWETANKSCPGGWRLPYRREWADMVKTVGSIDIYGEDGSVGKKLKAKNGWNNKKGGNGNGIDDYEFSALPGGIIRYESDFNGIGSDGYWWTATIEDDSYSIVYFRSMNRDDDGVREGSDQENTGMSVRCVQDKPDGGGNDDYDDDDDN
jgi:uncharacterized protein (TIGR02145 family)